MRTTPMLRADAIKIGDRDMVLPPGKTCQNCHFFVRCHGIYGHIAGDEVCDWSPSRFIERAVEATIGNS